MRSRIIGGLAGLVAATAALTVLAPAVGADTRTVSVDDNFFKPKRVTVTVGDRVTWKWNGFVAHNVVVEKGPQKFKSETQSEGKYSKVIKKPGVYRIVCTLHPGMTMKVTAIAAPHPTAATTPST